MQFLTAVVFIGLLSACDSSEERAEKHFQSSVALYEAGDIARAIIELRNVFQLNGTHLEARALMARIEEDRDNPAGAYSQYLAVTENHPENLEAQRAAARLAAGLGDWEAAARHVEAARALLAEDQRDPVIRAVELAVAYQQARRNQDLATARSVAQEAAALLEAQPELMLARRILIDDRVLRQDWEAALVQLDAGLQQAPEERLFYGLRLAALEQLGRTEAIEAQLRDMVDRFPEDGSLRQTLVRWYVSQNRTEDAEKYLRAQIDPGDPEPGARMALIAFLNQVLGLEVALEEIERLLDQTAAEDVNRDLYRAVRAGLIFESGERQKAIAQMQDILKDVKPSDRVWRIRVALAKMLVSTNNPVGARALVEEVLESDATNVEALKMRAAWMIEDDRPDEALVELRRALDQAPRDAGVFTLMARAQERGGSHDLMGEMLSRAVETSGGAPDESLRYAAFLMQDDRLVAAEGVLVDALRLQPGSPQLLSVLGDIYVRLQDWGRAQGVITALNGEGSEQATATADDLTVRVLAAQNRNEELRSLLEQLATSEGGNNQAVISTIRLHLAEGNLQGALDYLGERLAETPDDPDLRLVSAGLLAIEGKPAEARDVLQKLLDEYPQNERLWMALYNLHLSQGDRDTATKLLADALEALPDSANLKWAQAGELERGGDIEGAIAIYEDLYARNSNSAVIANNLASLISSFREDEESLQRAYAIARRLRGTDVAQFQDTYGWIAARLGNHAEALDYLEPAARGLPQDPTVRYHLARAYSMAGRAEKALEAYRAALELLETSGLPLPFRDEIADEIARLEAGTPPVEN
ncbi:MAG: tetratricopeptide repeat protein [Rhodobacter sp.]|nr:tetratricopeptide repeat protein [Rhodobacter sp.]